MHDYDTSIEIVRMVLALGIVVSILAYERWRLTSGAAIVAGYLALFFNRPLYVVTTVVLGIATHYLVQRVIARRMFLYGRRQLVVRVMVGMALQLVSGSIAFLASGKIGWLEGLYGVGFVLPGLIAQDMDRQGVRMTVLAVLGTSTFTFLLFRSALAIKGNFPLSWSSIAFEDGMMHYSYHTQLLVPAAILSVTVGALLFEWTGIRSGGFLTAAYMALFVLQPLHIVFIVSVGTLVYLAVARLLMRHTPIFGRTKFAMMVLVGLAFTWGLEVLAARLTRNAFVPFAGFSIISPMIAALIANDGERQGLPKTLIGVVACTLIVFVAIKGLDLFVLG